MGNVYFLLKCNKCGWWRKSTGLSEDLKDLAEIKFCHNCGGARKFKCPKCAQMVKMIRVNNESDKEKTI
jgi:hypothetical protein